MTARLVIMASGRGSNAAAVIAATREGTLGAEVVCVVSDSPGAGVVSMAKSRGVATRVVVPVAGEARHDYDSRLARLVEEMAPDVVVLAGWMRILSMSFLAGVGAPVVNLHPALPGDLPGTRAIERAHSERADGRTHSGVMVHFVPDEGVDDGPVIATRRVELRPDDSLEQFAARMRVAEHQLLVEALGIVLSGVEHDSWRRDKAQSTPEEAR